jgi:NAD(P)H-hydrate epimerase
MTIEDKPPEEAMRPVASTEEIRQLDRLTIEEDGLPGAALMENAGRAVAAAVLERFPEPRAGAVVILVGKGNNGGDGLVCARHLAGAGVEPLVFKLGEPAELSGEAALNWRVWTAGNRGAWLIEGAEDLDELRRALAGARVVVDALLGVGVTGAPRGLFDPVIRAVNESEAYVIAVDVPSGLDAETGTAELAVEAELTLTFAAPKTGLFLPPGYRLTGEIITVPIGMLPERFAELRTFYAEPGDAAPYFAPPPLDAHKGDRGRVAALAGSRDYSGAAALVCLAASRSGAGLVNLCTTSGALNLIKQIMPGVTSTEVTGEAGRVSPFASEVILRTLNAADAAVVGPGLGNDINVSKLLQAVLPHLEVPAVIDADGLNAADTELLSRVVPPHVLTPHPGEAGRLLGRSAAAVNADRLGAARELAELTGAVCLLKGYRSIVAAPDGTACFNTTGDWRMAVGGSGDVLAGIIGALAARGVEPFSAAVAAAYLHGLAGELAAGGCGDWSVAPTDILDHLPAAVAAARDAETLR